MVSNICCKHHSTAEQCEGIVCSGKGMHISWRHSFCMLACILTTPAYGGTKCQLGAAVQKNSMRDESRAFLPLPSGKM